MRNNCIDIAKGIGIILVIIGHCGSIPFYPIRHFIFSFHMPLFFIISGIFYKPSDIKVQINKDIKRLMLPYLFTSVALICIEFLFCLDELHYKNTILSALLGNGTPNRDVLFGNVPAIGAIWFLPALFIAKYTYRIVKSNFFNSTIISFTAFLIGRYLIFIPMSILSGITGVIFYAIGHKFKKYYLLEEKPNLKMILVMFSCWLFSILLSNLSLVEPRMDYYPIDVVGASLGSYIIILISKQISNLNHISIFLEYIGRNSLFVLCVHLIQMNISHIISFDIIGNQVLCYLFVPIASLYIKRLCVCI